MEYRLSAFDEKDRLTLVQLWEESVLTTHYFLSGEDFSFYKPMVSSMDFGSLNVTCCKSNSGELMGFFGVNDKNLDMLFLHPQYIGKGLGSGLMKYCIETLGVTGVEVNEQNELAVAFYLKHGFVTVKRNEQDGTGKPYPILVMKRNAEK